MMQKLKSSSMLYSIHSVPLAGLQSHMFISSSAGACFVCCWLWVVVGLCLNGQWWLKLNRQIVARGLFVLILSVVAFRITYRHRYLFDRPPTPCELCDHTLFVVINYCGSPTQCK